MWGCAIERSLIRGAFARDRIKGCHRSSRGCRQSVFFLVEIAARIATTTHAWLFRFKPVALSKSALKIGVQDHTLQRSAGSGAGRHFCESSPFVVISPGFSPRHDLVREPLSTVKL
jgi:hypothetical protein